MTNFEKIVALCKRRGFIYPSSEIYGGLANVYDYGPLGAEMLRQMRELWWNKFVRARKDVVGIESQIFMHPQVWEASGHAKGFSDPMVEDTVNNKRWRADHLVESFSKNKLKKEIDTDLMSTGDLSDFIKTNNVKSPDNNPLGEVRQFNLMFKTELGSVEGNRSDLFLRAETAQGMYVLFKNVTDSVRVQVPFGIAQHGKAFRNEVTKGKFIFRTIEFEQMEIQYFFEPPKTEADWKLYWNSWEKALEDWYVNVLGISKEKIRWKPHSKLIFYAKAASDVQYKFEWGFDEVSGLHYRTDYDLSTHTQHSGEKLEYRDPFSGAVYTPHVMESTWGLNRNLLMLLDNAYHEENDRVILKLNANVAPYQFAVFPLLRNKPELTAKAQEIYSLLVNAGFRVDWDDRGNIGKRYYAQDEIGTPKCITVDYQTLEDGTVTVRDRDTAEQIRLNPPDLV
jgi:glycyl-tRNA synthetase